MKTTLNNENIQMTESPVIQLKRSSKKSHDKENPEEDIEISSNDSFQKEYDSRNEKFMSSTLN